ncbi:retrovirus-related pol polyprotein from transposon TNT 1-94 [Tanacetum coccineum]|uniref:Retrovirus-related pol polyprotein from transposon TNT 1-94 n=1 Tax=Tanacetum coccineum TaxID=301880 RepID=A0ABQ5FX89_9ASTR
MKPKCSTCGSTDHLTKEHLEQVAVRKTLAKLKAQSSQGSSARKAPMIPKPFIDCKYYGFNDHHFIECEYYPGCDICDSISHEIADFTKKPTSTKRKPRIASQRSNEPTKNGRSRHMTRVKQYLHRYSNESGLKVVFGDNFSGNIKGYGLVNCNGITFTRVAYVNGLKHNLISISQLYDANFKVLFTKTWGTIFNQNNEVVLIAPRRMDFYVIDMSSFNEEKNAYEYSRYTWVFCLKKKSDAADCIMSFIKKMENLNDVRVKELRSDNETEFKNHKSIIVKRHGKIAYDVFRGRSPDIISYFYVFGCLMHIHNHKDHLRKFDAKADDGFFLGYSQVVKAIKIFNIKRQEKKETYHVTFNEDDEAISKSSTKVDEINFNENSSFPDDEFCVPRNKDSNPSDEHPEFIIADDHLILNEHDDSESFEDLGIAKDQVSIIIETYRWSREKHIELVNILSEPHDGVTTRSRIRDSKAASAHECLYLNFLSEIEPNKLIEALEEEE